MILMPDTTYERATEGINALLKKCGNATATNLFYQCMRLLLHRIQPVFIDRITVDTLLRHVASEVQTEDSIAQQNQPISHNPNSLGCLGLDLLLSMSATIPGAFSYHDSLATLHCLLESPNVLVTRQTLRIFAVIGSGLNENFPTIAANVIPFLGTIIQTADDSVKVKCAVRCIGQFFQGCGGLDEQLDTIWTELCGNLEFDNAKLESSIVAMGHLSSLNANIAHARLKPYVAKFFMQDIMLKTRECEESSSSSSSSSAKKSWVPRCELGRESRIRVQVVKMITRYCLAMIENDQPANQPSQVSVKATFSTMRLLDRILSEDGNISSSPVVSKLDMAHLRLVAGLSFLKLGKICRCFEEKTCRICENVCA